MLYICYFPQIPLKQNVCLTHEAHQINRSACFSKFSHIVHRAFTVHFAIAFAVCCAVFAHCSPFINLTKFRLACAYRLFRVRPPFAHRSLNVQEGKDHLLKKPKFEYQYLHLKMFPFPLFEQRFSVILAISTRLG